MDNTSSVYLSVKDTDWVAYGHVRKWIEGTHPPEENLTEEISSLSSALSLNLHDVLKGRGYI